MSFLKRLLGRDGGDGKAEARPEAGGSYPTRPPRVRVMELHAVSFKAKGSSGLGSLPVANLSAEGIGFILPSSGGAEALEGNCPMPGETIEGTLRIGEYFQDMRAEVRHVGPSLVGCRFIDPPSSFRQTVLQSFLTEFAALRMVRVNPHVLQATEEGAPALFVGDNGCELYYIESPMEPGRLIRFNISFFGNYLEGTADGKLVGGQLQEEEEAFDGGPRYKGSTIVANARPVSEDLLLSARRLLSNVEGLSPPVRQKLSTLLSARRATGRD